MTTMTDQDRMMAEAKAAPSRKEIAFTFDDVPRSAGAFLSPTDRRQKLIDALNDGEVQVAFFTNPGNLERSDPLALNEADPDEAIMAYAKAGHIIGNHSYSHPALSKTPIDAFLKDVDQASEWLEGRSNTKPWFRFPFLDEEFSDLAKRDAVREALKDRGLMPKPITIDVWDWNLEDRCIEATQAGKAIDHQALITLFVRQHIDGAQAADEVAKSLFGRSVAQVFLLHEADVTLLGIKALMASLRDEGWTIVTPERAYEDPIYNILPKALPSGGPLLESIARDYGLGAPLQARYDEFALSNTLFDQYVLGQKGAA
jgi:peptidoglycan-N-acetylglucosamine deacetylase